jgi:hypothetical protein
MASSIHSRRRVSNNAMSTEERKELTSLVVWLKTFPQIEETVDKENADESNIDWLENKQTVR